MPLKRLTKLDRFRSIGEPLDVMTILGWSRLAGAMMLCMLLIAPLIEPVPDSRCMLI